VNPSLIVVGGGITGLSTALAWARNVDCAQRPVLVLEKQPVVGGCVTSFKRQGYLFDTTQLIPDVSELLEYFGIEVELERFEGCYTRLFLASPETGTAKVIAVPSGVEEFRNMLRVSYPRERERIDRFFTYSKTMLDELSRLKVEPGALDLVRTLFSCPRIIRRQSQTFRQFVDSFGFEDPELKEVLDTFASFSGMPSTRVAALLVVGAMFTTLRGAFRPRAGFIDFPVRMAERLKQLGGTIRTRTEVERIVIEGDRAVGVRLTTGEVIRAENVVTTVDPKVAMGKLVGLETLRRLDEDWAEQVEDVRMSASSLHISLGLDDGLDLEGLGLRCGYNVITTGGDTFERLFGAFERGEAAFHDRCFHTAVICPSLVTGGKPSLVIRAVPMPAAEWTELRERDPTSYQQRKNAAADFFIEQVERYAIPGLRRHIVFRDVATPATFARYLGSPTGSNYDMASYPENFGRKRLRMRTPVAGLFQPKFSHGIWPGMQAGLQVADMLLENRVMGGYSRFEPGRVRRAIRLGARSTAPAGA